MRKVINDRIYDTKTAREICSWVKITSPDGTKREEILYRTRRGLYFIHSTDLSGQVVETIAPVSKQEAMDFAEGMLEITEYLGAFPQEAPDDIVAVLVPVTRGIKERLKGIAMERGETMGTLLGGIVTEWLDGRPRQ